MEQHRNFVRILIFRTFVDLEDWILNFWWSAEQLFCGDFDTAVYLYENIHSHRRLRLLRSYKALYMFEEKNINVEVTSAKM